MIIMQCDRCHHTISKCNAVDIGEKIGKYVVLRTNRDGINIRSIDHCNLEPLDLCSDCARHLTQFIEGYADVEADQGDGNGNEIQIGTICTNL